MIKIPKRPLFRNPIFAAFFLIIFLLLPFVYSLETGGWRLRFIFVYPYLILISILIFFKIKFNKKDKKLNLNCEAIETEINSIQEDIRNKKALADALSAKLKRYAQLKDFTDKLTSVVFLEDTANIVLAHSIALMSDFDSCILYLIDPKTYELNCFLSKSKVGAIVKSKKGDIFDYWVLKKMQPLLVEDVNKDFRFDVTRIGEEELRGINSLIIAPLLTYNKIIGILRIDSSRVCNFSQEDLRLLVTLSDLSAAAIENAILYKHSLDLAIRDGLTGLYLKKYFLERLEEELQRTSIKKGHLSLVMVDIDKFKDFNDKFGHIAGDLVLQTVSKELVAVGGREGNIVCRFGGEEFIIFFVDTDKDKAIRIAEDLRKSIKSKEIVLRRKSSRITISLGVVGCPEDGFELEDLMRKVDSLLYQAKRTGRDKVCFLEK